MNKRRTLRLQMHSQINLQIDFTAATAGVMSTISKVAERAGVSRTTVSHVVNHADRVSKPLRAKVQAAIDELGYRPNPQAQSLRTGRTNLIAMLIPDVLNPYFTELVKTVQAELEGAGLDALIFNTDVPGGHPEQHVRQYLRQLGGKRVDGMLVADFALRGLIDRLPQLDVPAVFIGHLPGHAVDSVTLDEFRGGYLMGEYLASRGHKRIAHVTGPKIFREADARSAGFDKALAEHGVKVSAELHYEGSFLQPSGREAVRWLYETHGDQLPSVVFFANSLMAIGALTEFYDRGIKVPDEIAVATFDDIAQLEYVRPRLTTVGNSPVVLAKTATRMLLERLNGKAGDDPRTETVPCMLQMHETA
jgi:DNA-binding LacI/PurR family transcriptional regulator